MNETPEDLERLQQLLDDSYAASGAHLREVITPERRLDAASLAARLDGMKLLVLATVTGDGRRSADLSTASSTAAASTSGPRRNRSASVTSGSDRRSAPRTSTAKSSPSPCTAPQPRST
jgi:hypothetical protein